MVDAWVVGIMWRFIIKVCKFSLIEGRRRRRGGGRFKITLSTLSQFNRVILIKSFIRKHVRLRSEKRRRDSITLVIAIPPTLPLNGCLVLMVW